VTGWLAAFQQQYGIVVFRYEKIPQGIWLETNRGTMVLQSLPQAYVQKADFVNDVYQAMGRSELLLPILPTRENEILTSFGSQYYYLMGWPATESEWMDYGCVGSSLARLHLTSVEALQDVRCKFSDYGNWSKVWSAKCEQLKKYEEIAARRIGTEEEDPFDSYFMDNVGYLKQVGALSLTYLDTCNYKQVCRNTMEFGRLSYINFGYEKFVTTPQGRVFFTDPFSFVEDVRVRDIAQFIKADVREYGWNPHNVYSFLSGYHAVSPLTPDEFTLMYALILLPGRLMKKIEYLYYRPSFFQPENISIALFKDETEGITPEGAYLEMKRMEMLMKEFPRFANHSFGVHVPHGDFSS